MPFPGKLRAFYEVASQGSIRKASERLNASPSSISRQVATLEREIGTALFGRSVTGMALTPAGQLVADYARGVVIDYDGLRNDLNDLRGQRRVTIRIAVVEGMVCEGAVHALRAFRDRFSDVSFRIEVADATDIVRGVLLGEFDVGISSLQLPHADLKIVKSIADPIELAVATKHPFAAFASVTLAQIATQPIGRLINDPCISLVDRALIEADIVLQPTLVTNSIEAVRSFVRGGTGVALLSRRTVGRDVEWGSIKGVPIRIPALLESTVDVIVLKGRRLSSIARKFIDQVAISLSDLDA